MKTRIVSVALILCGSALWVVLSNTARYSIKKWDAKFESVVRHVLDDAGLSQKNLVSSVHRVRRDDAGEWVSHHVVLRGAGPEIRDRVASVLGRSGATVEIRSAKDQTTLLVRRGGRLYQEIELLP